ncbi:MAG: peptide-methionine (S)-S-oxide reductase [Gammaproteobacteria bacterium]|nr:MAG: peptide-methionine (S)-S-oxide reductase [Gammaproteobacteria bacterium]
MQSHTIFNIPLEGELPADTQRILIGMGCFWGAERCFWKLAGVYRTSVGYAGGDTTVPTYEAVCTGTTGHGEVVEVVYKTDEISTTELLKSFWENHNPTQGMRQGNDLGSQYRSMLICFSDEQLQLAEQSRDLYQKQLTEDGYGEITTELLLNRDYYLAEEYHQQYLDKNPQGYCGLSGTGTCFI